MKIILNGLPLVYPISGVGQYTLQLGKALEVLLGDKNIFWFKNHKLFYRYGRFFNEGSNVIDRVQHHLKKRLRGVPGLKALFHQWQNYQFRSYVRKITPSLYHETNYCPFSFDLGPTLVTLYDLSFIRHPKWHPKDRLQHLEKFCFKKLTEVDTIITISEFSKKEIVALLGIDPQRIYVTYPGVDQIFKPEGERMKGLPDEYILFVGNLEPRKNLVTLLKAYQSFPSNFRRKYRLVITGAFGWHTREIKKMLRLFPENEKPILTGYLPQEWLPKLYRGASLFVYPSYYEGFGLPILEAMASGVPVITSHSTSLPEVVGDAGFLVNPDDTTQLKEAMLEVLDNEKKRREMIKKGIARARLFSWDKCARETLMIYEKVLAKK